MSLLSNAGGRAGLLLSLALGLCTVVGASRSAEAVTAPAARSADIAPLNRAVQELKQASGVEKYAALRAVWREWDKTDPTAVEEAIADVERDQAASAPLRAYATIVGAYARRRRGDLDGARAKIHAAGVVDKWIVLGPFDNEGKEGLEHAFAPEKEFGEALDLMRPYQGKERPTRWRVAPDVYGYGWLDLGDLDAPAREGLRICNHVRERQRWRSSAGIGLGGRVGIVQALLEWRRNTERRRVSGARRRPVRRRQ